MKKNKKDKKNIFQKYNEFLLEFFTTKLSSKSHNKHNIDTRPCKMPFERIEVYPDGIVYPCCPDFLYDRQSAGNIGNQDFEEIWNGKVFKNIRKKLKNRDFSFCRRELCGEYVPYEGKIPTDYKKGPKEIKISYDKECNYNCITCRDEVIVNSSDKMDLYNNVYLPKILQAANNADILTIAGSGDPFYSRHSKHLIKEIMKIRPNIKIRINSNGFFLNEETLTELGIQNNILGVSVSVDAANQETYKKILRTDAFDRVIKNLETMSEWKKQGKIEWIIINFVVHVINYKEMPEFVKLAQRLDAIAFFSTYRPWQSSELYKKYDEMAVFEPQNEHYEEFVEIMHDPVFQDKRHCVLEGKLIEIAQS